MIQAVLIFNTHGKSHASSRAPESLVRYLELTSPGKPRLSKFYTPLSPLVQQTLIAQIFSLISDRPSGVCNFLDAPDLVFPYPANSKNATEKGKERSKEEQAREDDIRVIYRHYATLYFVWVSRLAGCEQG